MADATELRAAQSNVGLDVAAHLLKGRTCWSPQTQALGHATAPRCTSLSPAGFA